VTSRISKLPGFLRQSGLVAILAALALPAAACPIPVYQYSLEWWDEDPYEIYVFDNGDLSEEQEGLIERLKGISEGSSDEKANVRLRLVQSDSEERLYAHSALRGERPDSLPWMVAYYPTMTTTNRAPVWQGELSAANLDALLDSPTRQAITKMLLDRVSVVWLLLESGDRSADNEAFGRLEHETKRLEGTLVPPDPGAFGMDIPITDIKFERMRLSRDNEDEQMLIRMLMQSEPDLVDFAEEPMVFPIFGRGLIMNALVGRGINAHMILDTAEFLTGACSCTVKSLNPGVDLLTAVEWGRLVEPMSEEFTTGPGGVGGFIDSADQAEKL